jgi:hypothetical protein
MIPNYAERQQMGTETLSEAKKQYEAMMAAR